MKANNDIIYIYALSHPETGETRYIGKTNNIKSLISVKYKIKAP